MELYQLKNLIDQVKSIKDRYEQLADLTGDNFNVFKILKVESSEVRMHSAFIAELLDPKGSHGQKDTFLKLFIKDFCFKENIIDTQSCNVEIEKYTGYISDDGTEGGRIDIMVTDRFQNHIVIENKIYAGDQNNQLTRYHKHSPNADLLYLSLYGKEPSPDSRGELENGKHFKCYSYRSDLIKWLEDCRKEVTIYPIIRESITIYINLIKYLTNQTTNHAMQEELSNLLKANIEASFTISANLDKALEKISQDFGHEMELVCREKGLVCKYGFDFESNYSGIWIFKPEWKFMNIGFQFQAYDKDLIYGLCTKKHPKNSPIPLDLKDNLKKIPNNTPKNNDWWPWSKKLETPYNNWGKYEAWKLVIDGSMKRLMEEKIDYLLNATADISSTM